MSETGTLTLKQTGRLLTIDTPLGPDVMLLTELTGEDAISQPFLFEVTVATTASETDVRSLLGGPTTLYLGASADSAGFPVNGMVRRVSGYTVDPQGLAVWRLEVVPRLWFLSCIADCRIFQTQSAKDILQTIFGEQGITDFEFRGGASLPTMDYCVQYRETTLAFVSRLMERFGLFYWHEHTDSSHTLVIADANNRAKPVTEGDAAFLGGAMQSTSIAALAQDYSYRPGKWTMTDYDFTAPSKSLLASTPTLVTDPASMKQHEIYDYPGIYTDTGAGGDITKMHVEIEEALYQRVHGRGALASFGAGRRCKAKGPEEGAKEEEFLLTRVRHRASEQSHGTGRTTPARYENEFTAVPMDVPYRHPTGTPRPLMHGPQTAIVTGPSGEKIFTDKYGRVKVQFHWDRLGKNDDKSSCWIRVSQSWAGRAFGTIHIPRIGQEVIVEFLEGDPDQPIVTGRVYNGTNSVPYTLPDNKTQSGIKTASVPSGGSNELRFEDKAGSEEIYLHAQKDLTAVVENNETRTVKNNQTETIQGNVSLTVDKSVTANITQDVSETIGQSVKKTVGGSVTQTVTGSVTQTVTGSVSQTVTGSVSQTFAASLTQTVVGGITVTTPATMTVTAVGGYNLIAPSQAWQTGPTSLSAYGFSMSSLGEQVQTVGSSQAVIGMQQQAVGLNVAVNGIAQTTNGLHLHDVDGISKNDAPMTINNYALCIFL